MDDTRALDDIDRKLDAEIAALRRLQNELERLSRWLWFFAFFFFLIGLLFILLGSS